MSKERSLIRKALAVAVVGVAGLLQWRERDYLVCLRDGERAGPARGLHAGGFRLVPELVEERLVPTDMTMYMY